MFKKLKKKEVIETDQTPSEIEAVRKNQFKDEHLSALGARTPTERAQSKEGKQAGKVLTQHNPGKKMSMAKMSLHKKLSMRKTSR